jgi:hypothetical protein
MPLKSSTAAVYSRMPDLQMICSFSSRMAWTSLPVRPCWLTMGLGRGVFGPGTGQSLASLGDGVFVEGHGGIMPDLLHQPAEDLAIFCLAGQRQVHHRNVLLQ